MATLYVFGDTDTEQPITSMAELRAAMPVVPHNPSIHALDFVEQSIQVVYGDPDRTHHTVKCFTKFGVEKRTYDTVKQATDAFLNLASKAL